MTVQYLQRVKYLCDYGTDNCPICPGIKAVTSDVQTRAFLLLQQAEYFIKALISTSPFLSICVVSVTLLFGPLAPLPGGLDYCLT